METNEKLINLAQLILKENPECSLSGSLALNIQNIKTKRFPGDIDIFLPHNTPFKKISGLVEIYDFNKDDYENDEYDRIHYCYLGEIKVDVFTPMQDDSLLDLISVHGNQGFSLIRFDEIIKFKIKFAFDDHSSAEKHADDIIFSLQQQKTKNAINPLF